MIQDFGDAARYGSRNGYDKWWTKLITKKKKKKKKKKREFKSNKSTKNLNREKEKRKRFFKIMQLHFSREEKWSVIYLKEKYFYYHQQNQTS